MCTDEQITQLAAKLWNELYPKSNYYSAGYETQRNFNSLSEKLLKGQISLENPFFDQSKKVLFK